MYAPTILAAARDFWTLRYSTCLEDGSYVVSFLDLFFMFYGFYFSKLLHDAFYHCLQVCERSLTSTTGGPNGPPSSSFVRAEMRPSGFLIRPCDGGGSIVHIVDHVDLDVSNEPNSFKTHQFCLINMFLTLFISGFPRLGVSLKS